MNVHSRTSIDMGRIFIGQNGDSHGILSLFDNPFPDNIANPDYHMPTFLSGMAALGRGRTRGGTAAGRGFSFLYDHNVA
jgi:hypothetical protein